MKEKTIKTKKTTNSKKKSLAQIMKALTKNKNLALMNISIKISMAKATKMSKIWK